MTTKAKLTPAGTKHGEAAHSVEKVGEGRWAVVAPNGKTEAIAAVTPTSSAAIDGAVAKYGRALKRLADR